MKVICIEDRQWNSYFNTFSIRKCPTITKGKVYEVVAIIKLFGQTHYRIKCDKGHISHYFHTRFKTKSFSNLKVI